MHPFPMWARDGIWSSMLLELWMIHFIISRPIGFYRNLQRGRSRPLLFRPPSFEGKCASRVLCIVRTHSYLRGSFSSVRDGDDIGATLVRVGGVFPMAAPVIQGGIPVSPLARGFIAQVPWQQRKGLLRLCESAVQHRKRHRDRSDAVRFLR